jgi:hypothetical protein
VTSRRLWLRGRPCRQHRTASAHRQPPTPSCWTSKAAYLRSKGFRCPSIHGCHRHKVLPEKPPTARSSCAGVCARLSSHLRAVEALKVGGAARPELPPRHPPLDNCDFEMSLEKVIQSARTNRVLI